MKKIKVRVIALMQRIVVQLVCFIHALTLNFEAKKYYEFVDLESYKQQSPAIEKLRDTKIEECLMKPLSLHHPCYNQIVERHVENVTEASAQKVTRC